MMLADDITQGLPRQATVRVRHDDTAVHSHTFADTRCQYIYIYIEREREINVYIRGYTCIYIYIEREREIFHRRRYE